MEWSGVEWSGVEWSANGNSMPLFRFKLNLEPFFPSLDLTD